MQRSLKQMVQLMQQQQSEILQLRSTLGRQSQVSDAVDRLTSQIETLESTIAAQISEHYHQQTRADCIHLYFTVDVKHALYNYRRSLELQLICVFRRSLLFVLS